MATSSRHGIASTPSRSRTARFVASCGDPELLTYFRSSAKPIQALPIIRARPDLDDAEIAIACASHLHRPDQLEPVRRLLAKAEATEDDLECGPEPTRLEHNCSGKHAAMLLLCRERGWPIEGYRLAVAPLPAGDARRDRGGRRSRSRVDADRGRRLRGRDLCADARADGARLLAPRVARRRPVAPPTRCARIRS